MITLYCISFSNEVFAYHCKQMWEDEQAEMNDLGLIHMAYPMDITVEQNEALLNGTWVLEKPDELH